MARQSAQDRLLVYKPEDDSIDFGTKLIDALRLFPASRARPPGADDLAAYLAERFPAQTYRLDPEAGCDHYLPVDPMNARAVETLLVDCPGGLRNAFGQSFRHWGYQIVPRENRLNVLRGYQTTMPNDSLRHQMNKAEFLHFTRSMHAGIRLFPNRYIDPFNLRKLPSREEFSSALATSLIVY